MQDPADLGQVKERHERPLPQHKSKEKIGIDEGFVKGVGEETVPEPQPPRPNSPHVSEPSRIKSARERRKALIRKRKLLD
jgi:hypothetical protein